MRHVRVFAQPICRFHLVPMLIKHFAGRFQAFSQRFFNLLRYQFLAVFVIRFTFIVHEEVDTSCQEVHRRCLEELVTATATFLLSFLQGFKEGFGCFTGSCQVVDVLLLDRIHPSAVFHIHKVDDIELASLRQITVLLVLQIVVVKFGCQCGELIVIYHHGKALGTVLTDKWFNDGESLTRTGSTDHPCATERIHHVHPSFTELALVIVTHRDVHRIFVLLQGLALLERFVLQIETIFQQSFLQKLRDVIQRYMYKNRTQDGSNHIKDNIQTQGIETEIHGITEQPYRQDKQADTANKWIQHLFPCIKLQMFLVSGSDTGDADEYDRSNLAIHQIAVLIDEPPFDAVMQVTDDAVPMVKHFRINGIFKEFHQQGDIDYRPEYLVRALKFLTFFHDSYPLSYCYLLMVMMGRDLCAWSLGVSCNEPLPME